MLDGWHNWIQRFWLEVRSQFISGTEIKRLTLAIVTDGLRFIHRRRVNSGVIQNGETIRFFRFTLTQEQAINGSGAIASSS
jgi:hypothetical protein